MAFDPSLHQVADGSSAAIAADEKLLDRISAEMDSVETALSRLDDGSFRYCELCEEPIGHDRLLADPLSRHCGSHPARVGQLEPEV